MGEVVTRKGREVSTMGGAVGGVGRHGRRSERNGGVEGGRLANSGERERRQEGGGERRDGSDGIE